MLKKDIPEGSIESIFDEIRKRREKAFKQRDRNRRKVKATLSKEEITLWESEKRLMKSQQKLIITEQKFQKVKKEYQDELWNFIQHSTKANQAKRKAGNKGTK